VASQIRRFVVTVDAESPIRVGGVAHPFCDVENPVATSRDQAIIPGPSLKGALRAQIEEYLSTRVRENREPSSMLPCVSGDGPSQHERKLIRDGKRRETCCAFDPEGPGSEGAGICPACYLLGAPGLVGFVSVPFLTATRSIEELAAIKIDRQLSTTVKGFRTYQFLPQGTQFNGELHVVLEDPLLGWTLGKPRYFLRTLKEEGKEEREEEYTPDLWLKDRERHAEEVLDELVIQRLKAIALLGGFKSKGFGQVSVTVTPAAGS
jgi:CRISPR/Cas system CSM-associated protein Csm3 (group 7 of RAMP superfamily)